MVQFNPDVPNQADKAYWHWSKSIPQPRFEGPVARPSLPSPPTLAAPTETGVGEALRMGAHGLESLTQGADEFIKQYAAEASTEAATPIQERYTKGLQFASAAIQGQEASLLP